MVGIALQKVDLPRRKLSALKRKAERLGITPETYVKQLIEDDLSLDRKARITPLHELAAPFRKALGGIAEDALDHMVDAARGRRPSSHKR